MPVQGGVRFAAYRSMPTVIRYIMPERAANDLAVPMLPLLLNEALLALGNRVSLHPVNGKTRAESSADGCVPWLKWMVMAGRDCSFSKDPTALVLEKDVELWLHDSTFLLFFKAVFLMPIVLPSMLFRDSEISLRVLGGLG